MKQPKLVDIDVFSSDKEAAEAFFAGRLEWRRSDKALVFRTRKVGDDDVVEGHETVTVLAVVGIAADGSPVYGCEKDDGSPVVFEARQLLTEKELFLDGDGRPSNYARWMQRRMVRSGGSPRNRGPSSAPVTAILILS